jgi:hypothetical protein
MMSPQPSHRFQRGRAAAEVAFAFALIASQPALAKGPKRCDWHGPLSGGETQYAKCVDFAAMNGKTIDLPKNVTRIAADGLSFCAPKNPVQGPAEADIVFIYDNSGSMTADGIFVGGGNDTNFYFLDKNNGTGCFGNPVTGTATYKTRDGGTWTVSVMGAERGCGNDIAGDPYQARGPVIKEGIDFLTKSSPTSTAGVMAFNSTTKYEVPPKPVSDAAGMNQVKNAIQLDTSGGTEYGPPLQLAKQWLTDPSIIKTKKQAIIFISDGAPNHYNYANLLDGSMPAIYSIYLAKDEATTAAVTRLKELADATGGTYTRVNPKDPNTFLQVMKGIITTITTNPGMPKAVTISNKSLSPPQTSQGAAAAPNPDGSIGMKLDSIIGLAEGKNNIEIQLTRDDNSTATYAFTMNVAADPISSTSGNFSCYDVPTLTAIDKATNQPPEVYSPEKTSYQLKLTRSPSELGDVSVSGTTPNNDKEGIKVGNTDMSLGYPVQTGDFNYNANKGNPSANNGVMEVDNHGDMTFTWTHPRDPRETVTYVLPGRIIPVLNGRPAVEWLNDPSKDGGDQVKVETKPQNPVIITTMDGKCITNCTGTEEYHKSLKIPALKLTIRSPISYRTKIFDNFGQFVNQSSGQLLKSDWDKLGKSGDSAEVVMKLLPFSENGQALGTGAYVLVLNVDAEGKEITKNAAGESIVVKSGHKEYVRRFGYLRAH